MSVGSVTLIIQTKERARQMLYAEGEIETITHNDKIFIDFEDFVSHYCSSLMATQEELAEQELSETDKAINNSMSFFARILLETLAYYSQKEEIEKINNLDELNQFLDKMG
jgi:hypothetical protein